MSPDMWAQGFATIASEKTFSRSIHEDSLCFRDGFHTCRKHRPPEKDTCSVFVKPARHKMAAKG